MSTTGPVLYGTDFSALSRAGVPWARKLAESFDVQLHCVHVVDDSPFLWVGAAAAGPTVPTTQELCEQAKARMTAFQREHLQGLKHEPVMKVLVGKPFVELVRYARAVDAGVLVMTTHGRTGLSHVLLGSTTETVVRRAPCPVLVVRNPEITFEMP